MLAITTDTRDVLWLCSALKGVMAWDGTVLTRFEQQAEVFNRACLSMASDSRDRVWIGFQGGDVAVHDRGTFQVFGERDGLVAGPRARPSSRTRAAPCGWPRAAG